jgi:DNA-binding response OmpR family regulator
MNNKTILCVEDNLQVQTFNKPLLEARGFTVRLAMTLAEAREALEKETPDLIILDIRLPDGSGLDFLRELRKVSAVPVIALTNDGAEQDIVAGLAGGCDDYMSKPYTFPVLHARIEALLRRAERAPETIAKGRLSLDMAANMASLDGKDLRLTPKEFALLLIFTQNEECFMSAEYLYERVWKRPMISDSQAVRKTVSKLRDKIAGSGWSVIWLRGEGWCFGKE